MRRVFLASAFSMVLFSRAHADFGPASSFWDGGKTLQTIAVEEAPHVVATSSLDLDRLRPTDAVVLLAPDGVLPVNDLVRFARAGGRLVVADDFGSGREMLSRFGIALVEADTTGAPRLRGEEALVVAERTLAHPLSEGVPALVTNRPAALAHPNLHAIFVTGRSSLVLTGLVGRGRVIAIGDPSIFLNEMMALAPHRRFARNLVRFVTDDSDGTLYLVRGEATWSGTFDADAPGSLRARLDSFLADLARTRLPDDALRVLAASLALATTLLLLALRTRSRDAVLPWLEASDAPIRRSNAAREGARGAALVAARKRLGVRDDAAAVATLTRKLSRDDARFVRSALHPGGSPDAQALSRALALVETTLSEQPPKEHSP